MSDFIYSGAQLDTALKGKTIDSADIAEKVYPDDSHKIMITFTDGTILVIGLADLPDYIRIIPNED